MFNQTFVGNHIITLFVSYITQWASWQIIALVHHLVKQICFIMIVMMMMMMMMMMMTIIIIIIIIKSSSRQELGCVRPVNHDGYIGAKSSSSTRP